MVVLLLWPLAMAMTVPSPKDTDGGSREGEMGVKMSMGPITRDPMSIYSIRVPIWSETSTHGYTNGANPTHG